MIVLELAKNVVHVCKLLLHVLFRCFIKAQRMVHGDVESQMSGGLLLAILPLDSFGVQGGGDIKKTFPQQVEIYGSINEGRMGGQGINLAAWDLFLEQLIQNPAVFVVHSVRIFQAREHAVEGGLDWVLEHGEGDLSRARVVGDGVSSLLQRLDNIIDMAYSLRLLTNGPDLIMLFLNGVHAGQCWIGYSSVTWMNVWGDSSSCARL